MNNKSTRRGFIKRAAVLPLYAAVGMRFDGLISTAAAADQKKSKAGDLKVSLNAYSFNKMLNDNIKNRGPGITLLAVLDFCAHGTGSLTALMPRDTLFPGLSQSAIRGAYTKRTGKQKAD